MADYKSDIRNSIRTIANNGGAIDYSSVVFCVVDSVDEAKRTCNVTTISNEVELEIPDVYLQASTDNGFILYPKVGSDVAILLQEKVHPIVVMYSAVDKVLASQPLWQFNKGENAGMVKVIELTQKLNALENDLNNYKTLLQTMVNAMLSATSMSPTAPVLNGTLSSYFSPLLPYTAQVLPVTTQTQIEDTKITH